MERSLKLSESEVSSLQEQLDAKTTSLDEAIKEIENMRRDRNSDESESDKRQRRIDELNIEVSRLAMQWFNVQMAILTVVCLLSHKYYN